jgi:hypothetical protein
MRRSPFARREDSFDKLPVQIARHSWREAVAAWYRGPKMTYVQSSAFLLALTIKVF